MSAALTELERDAPARAPQPALREAVRWGQLTAACACLVWAAALLYFRPPVTAEQLRAQLLDATLLLGAVASASGLVAGVLVGLGRRGPERVRTALTLAVLGAFAGAVGGGLSAPAAVAFSAWLHPVLGSALAWALAGFLAGALGSASSRWARSAALPTDDPDEDEDEDAPPARRVEWVLPQPRRRASEWPGFGVLPVLAVTALVLVGAAARAPADLALALAGVGALGLAVALVLHAQETRLRRLEARLRHFESRFPGAREDEHQPIASPRDRC